MNRRILESYRKMRARLNRAVREAEELQTFCEEYLGYLSEGRQNTRRLVNSLTTYNMLKHLRSLNRQLRGIPLPPEM